MHLQPGQGSGRVDIQEGERDCDILGDCGDDEAANLIR